MKLVKIINGTYGYRPAGSTHPVPKNTSSPPFKVEDAEAARLVKLKVAEYADKPDAENNSTADISGAEKPAPSAGEPVGERKNEGEGDNLPEDKIGAENTENGYINSDGDDENENVATPEYNAEMSVADLKLIMKDCGLTYKVGMSRADMVKLLDKYFSEAPPLLSTEEPVT